MPTELRRLMENLTDDDAQEIAEWLDTNPTYAITDLLNAILKSHPTAADDRQGYLFQYAHPDDE